MNDIIICFGSLFGNIYKLKTDKKFSNSDIFLYTDINGVLTNPNDSVRKFDEVKL